MRKWTSAGVVAILALVLASAALADLTQVAHVTLTAHRAGQSSGIASSIQSSDPTAPGGKPEAARRLVITFPAHTKFNLKTSLVKACTRSDSQLRNQFGPTCPRKSQIGTGTAVANASPVAATIKTNVKAYAGKDNQIILVLKPTLTAFASEIIVIRAAVSGSKLTIPIPRVVLGKAPGFAGVTVVLVSLKLHVGALGKGRTALITAGRCTAHKFVVGSHFDYADHSTLDVLSSSSCT